MSRHLKQYVDYIKNTGRVPLAIADFDEDWEPIGPTIRRDMVRAGLIEEWEGGLVLVAMDT